MSADSVAAEQGPEEALYRALRRPRFEVVPVSGLEGQIVHLPPGATVTVTCSPTKGVENTLDCAEMLRGRGFQVVPHISARLVTGERHLREILRRLDHLDLREIFVIGGDAREARGPFTSTLELLEAMASMVSDVERIGVSGYPEPHPLIDDMVLEQALWEKRRFAHYIVTQICFDPAAILSWLGRIRKDGIALPVYIGLPGVVDRKHLLQVSLKIGVGDSTRFLAKHRNLVRMLIKPGGYDPTELVMAQGDGLKSAEAGIAGFHLNTFNQVESTEEWRRAFLERLQATAVPDVKGSLRDVC